MRDELIVDLWDEPCHGICITTNGYIKKDGSLVMGAGVAGQAQARWDWLPADLGSRVSRYGNVVHALRLQDTGLMLFSFPVKHNWWEKADLDLIRQSAEQLQDVVDTLGDPELKILLPRPGCGNGQLEWSDVKPVIEPILDDRVWAVTNSL